MAESEDMSASGTSADAWAGPADTGDTAGRPVAMPETAPEAPKRSTRGAGFVLGTSWFILGCVAGRRRAGGGVLGADLGNDQLTGLIRPS